MYVNMYNPKFVLELCTESKYSIILGKSGTGKSYAAYVLESLSRVNANNTKVDTSHQWELLDSKRTIDSLEKHPEDYTGKIYFVDEFAARGRKQVFDKIEAYFIIISRSDKVMYDCSYKDIYRMYVLDGVTRVQRRYEDITLPKEPYNFDVCITEDSGKGAKFFRKWLWIGTIGGDGKDSFSKYAVSAPRGLNILLVFDGGGAGSHIRKIMTRVNALRKEANVYLCVPECFEHILLCSSLIKHNKEIIPDLSSNMTTEQFCERTIEELTKDAFWEYTHKGSKLSNCWVIECDDCDNNCASRVENKLQSILKAGPCPELLNASYSGMFLWVDIPVEYSPSMVAALLYFKKCRCMFLATKEHVLYVLLDGKRTIRIDYKNGFAVYSWYLVKTTQGIYVFHSPDKQTGSNSNIPDMTLPSTTKTIDLN